MMEVWDISRLEQAHASNLELKRKKDLALKINARVMHIKSRSVEIRKSTPGIRRISIEPTLEEIEKMEYEKEQREFDIKHGLLNKHIPISEPTIKPTYTVRKRYQNKRKKWY